MKSVLRWIVVGALLYFGINWIADHPRQVKAFCKQMNQTVETILSTTKETINNGAKEVASQTE